MSENFPTVDITHYPTRTQQGNMEEAERLRNPNAVKETTKEPLQKTFTPESAYEYYRNHAQGKLVNLYTQTSEWLAEYIILRSMRAKYEKALASENNPDEKNS